MAELAALYSVDVSVQEIRHLSRSRSSVVHLMTMADLAAGSDFCQVHPSEICDIFS